MRISHEGVHRIIRRLAAGDQPFKRTRGRLRGLLRHILAGIPLLKRVARLAWLLVLEALAVGLSVVLAPLFYWRLLTTNPNDVATLPVGDFTDLHYPYRRWVAEELARGEQPLWNAFVSAGHSAIGDIQFHVFYPIDRWLALQVGGGLPFRTLELDVVGHVALGGFFTYLLGRRLTGSRIGGLVAAVVFAFGGYLTTFPVQQMILLETSIWLPLILLCVDVGADLNLVSAFVAGAGALALAALAGHPQTLFYVGLAAALYLIFKGWNHGRLRLAVLPGLPVLFLGGLGLAAPALVPAAFHLGLTNRTDVSFSFSSTGFALHEALGLVFPTQLGGAALYCGIPALLLAAVALQAPYRRSNKLFWVTLALLGLLLSFGGGTFLQSLSYLALGSLKFRDYERLAFLCSFGVAILAGYGAAEVVSNRDLRLEWLRRAFAWSIGILFGLLILVAPPLATSANDAQGRLLPLVDRVAFTGLLAGLATTILLMRERRRLRPVGAGLLLLALVGFDLFSTNWQNNLRPGDPDQILAPTPIVEYLNSYTTGLYRIASEGLLPGDGNAGALFRLQDVVGNSPLETRDYADFVKRVPETVRWQILNVRYVVTRRKLDDPRLHLLQTEGDKYLYEVDQKLRLPRAYVVHQTILAPSHDAALAVLPGVDLRKEAVVEGSGPLLQGQTSDRSTVEISDYRSNDLTLRARLADPGLLVVSEVDYPGWNASVDGRPAAILRVDGIIRGLALDAGEHVIRFSFVPPGLAEGAAIGGAAQRLLVDLVAIEIALRLGWLGATTLRRSSPRLRRSRSIQRAS